MLMSGDVPRGSVCTTNEVSAFIERLQFALGEGPCIDAFQQDQPVLEPDLTAPSTCDGRRSAGRRSQPEPAPCSASLSASAPSGWGPQLVLPPCRGPERRPTR